MEARHDDYSYLIRALFVSSSWELLDLSFGTFQKPKKTSIRSSKAHFEVLLAFGF
jgi:hypothetical protein